MDAIRFGIEVQVQSFPILPYTDHLLDFEDVAERDSLAKGLDTTVTDPTIILDYYLLPLDNYIALVGDIVQGTAWIVSNGLFNPDSSVGPTGTSAVVLAPFVDYNTKLYAKGNNWVPGSKKGQSMYCSKLAGVILALTDLDVPVHHHNITVGSVTITLDGESALDQSGGNWPLSVDQPSFDYLQVICS